MSSRVSNLHQFLYRKTSNLSEFLYRKKQFLNQKKSRSLTFLFVLAVVLDIPVSIPQPLTVTFEEKWALATVILFLMLLFLWYGIPWITHRGQRKSLDE